MAEMYDLVKNNESKRRGKLRKEWKIAALIAAAVIVLGVIGGVLWWKLTAGTRFSKFCAKLSESTSYAYKNDSAKVEDDDGVRRLSRENAYEIYQCACVYGPGDERLSAPDGDGVTITYGDGSFLRLVDEGEGNESRLCFCYSDGDGSTHSFTASGLSIRYLNGRYLNRDKNE